MTKASERQAKYDKEHTVTVRAKLNKRTDADIIGWLDSQPSKQGAIKTAIRHYINR